MLNFLLFFLLNIFLAIRCFGSVKCAQEKILICGVIKNGEKGFLNVKNCAESLGRDFADYRVIVYENNSVDSTKELYKSWALENSKVIFISEDLTQEFLDNYTIKLGDYRTEFIARARNIVLEKALSHEFDDFAYHVMVDLDGIGSWPIEEIKNTIENPQFEWDAVCSNGSYDLYAIRSNKFRLNGDLIQSIWSAHQTLIGQKLHEILDKGIWFKIESAFGGLAIYKRNSIINSVYKGRIAKEYVQKILKDTYRQDLIFKRFSQNQFKLLRKNLKKLKEWELSGFKKDFDLFNYYMCEHVQFHYDMIQKGHDKIFINPSLKVLSLEHPNY
jgi:hypothetical protein